jgi:hypothetical protein
MERSSRGTGDLRDPARSRRRRSVVELGSVVGGQGRPPRASQIGDDAGPRTWGSNSGIVRSTIPAAESTTSYGQGADLVKILVAWPLNGEIISATPTLVRVSREAEENEETASSVH